MVYLYVIRVWNNISRVYHKKIHFTLKRHFHVKTNGGVYDQGCISINKNKREPISM